MVNAGLLVLLALQPVWDAGPDPQGIKGGAPAAACAWPNVPLLTNATRLCSATLVHPLVVLTAAHCVQYAPMQEAHFGESEANWTSVEIEYCEINPDFVDPPTDEDWQDMHREDWAFCKLAEPVTNVPIIPVAQGCELDAVGVGARVAAVGFGRDDADANGTKRVREVEIVEYERGERLRGQATVCHGDSGGPTFIQLADGSLRQIGIHSWISEPEFCTTGFFADMPAENALPFVEERTGLDITPCFTAEGEWAPNFACQEVPKQPWVGGAGTYAQGCPPGPTTDFVGTCGPVLTETPDDDAPTVSILQPASDTEVDLAAGDATAPVLIEGQADDGDGWGLASVELLIEPVDGAPLQDTKPFPPFVWDTDLPEGGYHVQLIATDHAGHVAVTDWHRVGVGVPPPPPRDDDEDGSTGSVEEDSGSDSDSTDSGTGESDDGSGGTTGAADSQDTSDSCACRPGRPTPTDALALLLVALVRRRRRTSK